MIKIIHFSRFVDNGKTEGFMPCSTLTPYNEMYHDNNLIEFENNSRKINDRDSLTNTLLFDKQKDMVKEEVVFF
jgi:hypothetical protein